LFSRERILFLSLLFGTAFLALLRLGALPLTDPDEAVYGQVGKELARLPVSHWLTPLYDGKPWFDKPPLFYWLSALSMRAFGVSEFAARLPSALMSVVLVGATYALGQRACPQIPRVGLWAGFALATNIQFFMLSRAAVTDMTLAACLTVALLALWAWAVTHQARWALLAGLATGMAVLTKGPAFLILIGAQAVFFLCLTRQARRLLSPALWGGFIVSLLVSVPWFALMIHQHGQRFIQGFLEANNVTRYLKAEHQSTQAFWFFLPVFLGLFFPWTVALPATVRDVWRQVKEEWHSPSQLSPTIFLALWFVLVFLFFSVSQSKLITYIFPLYPVAAILVGHQIYIRVKEGQSDWPLLAVTLLLYFVCLALAIESSRYGVDSLTRSLWLLTAFGQIFIRQRFQDRQRRWIVPGMATALILLIAWCSPVWKTKETEISERLLTRAAPPGQTIYALGLKKPSLRFYAAGPVVYTDDHLEAQADIQSHSGRIYAMRPEDLDAMRPQVSAQDYTLLQTERRTVLLRATPPAFQKLPQHDTIPTR
jgi:4-amino-4-deoxy-L-arabinose transferase-like glycosyltransferase